MDKIMRLILEEVIMWDRSNAGWKNVFVFATSFQH